MIFTEHVLDSGAVPDDSTIDTLFRVFSYTGIGYTPFGSVSLLGLKQTIDILDLGAVPSGSTIDTQAATGLRWDS